MARLVRKSRWLSEAELGRIDGANLAPGEKILVEPVLGAGVSSRATFCCASAKENPSVEEISATATRKQVSDCFLMGQSLPNLDKHIRLHKTTYTAL